MKVINESQECSKNDLMAVKDALKVLNGRVEITNTNFSFKW